MRTNWIDDRLKQPTPEGFRNIPCGLTLIDRIKSAFGETVLMSFSLGKDSVCAWLAIRDHFEIVPFYLYGHPLLSFEEEALDYYERIFKAKVILLPHEFFYVRFSEFQWQTPRRIPIIEKVRLKQKKFSDLERMVREHAKLDPRTMVATGVRALDNLQRRTSIKRHGPISFNLMKVHPIWDWTIADVQMCLVSTGTRLPKSYAVFGSSFDNLGPRYLVPLRRHYPDDYRKLLEWYPLADLICFRYDCAVRAGLVKNPY